MRKQFNVGIYTRLSIDDVKNHARTTAKGFNDESMSITNQKELLSAHVSKMGWNEVKTYSDDGYSGSTFERPAFEEMMNDVHNKVINLILVKDLSRFGRNYIEVGRYTDFILPSLGCRFVALSDGIDTSLDNNDMMHFRSLLNDYYLKDVSKKIKASHRVMAQEGKRVAGRPPYGYTADSKDHHKFVIDEYAAGVVRRMYEMRLQGMSYSKIAGTLNTDGILSPREYEYQSLNKEYPYKIRSVWLTKSVKTILHSECYLGHRVQLKQGTLSHRLHKIVYKPKEEWIRIENTHEGIISSEDWNAVQTINSGAKEKYGNIPKRTSLFRGMLRCPDCGSAFTYTSSQCELSDGTIKAYPRYQCLRYAQTGTANCSSHSIKEDVLKQIVMDNIKSHAGRISIDTNKVISELQKKLKHDNTSSQSDIGKMLKHIKLDIFELEQKIAKLYEDKVSGNVSEQTFTMLIQDYESERSAAKAKQLDLLEKQVEDETTDNNISNWINLIDKHSAIEDIDRELLEDLIDRIEIGKVENVDGSQRQEIKIFYKMVGAIE